MTIPSPARKRRPQILDDETSDAARLKPGAHDGMSDSEDLWVKNFMARLAASVRSLGSKP